MKRRLLFILSRFLDGGIDMVLMDYLRQLAQHGDYELGLAISLKLDELEVFAPDVPKGVEVVHLVDQSWLTKWPKRKITSKLPAAAKIYDQLLLAPIRRHLIGKGLRQLAQDYDVMIDFDCCHYAYLKSIKTKKMVWFHFSFNHLMAQQPLRMQRIGRHLAFYDRVVVISKAMLEEGKALFPWLEDKWALIYNAKDEQLLVRRADETPDDPRIDEPYILSVERLEESQKDTTTLLHAFQRLKRDYHIQEKLYLLGKGRDKEKLEHLAGELGIGGEVVFLGFSANPYPWIRQARLIVHSAKMEGLPTAMIEALVMGKLIVATDCPTGPREILDDGQAGELVPVGDPQAMAEAIASVLGDEQRQQRLLAQAARHKQHFCFDTTLRQLEQLLDSIV